FGRVDHRDTETFDDYHATDLHGGRSFADVPEAFFSPPTETCTWFHQGPIGDQFGDWDAANFSAEFWAGDPSMLTEFSDDSAFPSGLPRRAKRDAYRALRGSILRTELYALDGNNDPQRTSRPYTITEHVYGVSEVPTGLQPSTAPDDDTTLRVFFPRPL